jgi:hypothetical protein
MAYSLLARTSVNANPNHGQNGVELGKTMT